MGFCKVLFFYLTFYKKAKAKAEAKVGLDMDLSLCWMLDSTLIVLNSNVLMFECSSVQI